MNTTINVNGINYTIPNDKIQNVISLLEAYKVTEKTYQQVKEVLSSRPNVDGRSLING